MYLRIKNLMYSQILLELANDPCTHVHMYMDSYGKVSVIGERAERARHGCTNSSWCSMYIYMYGGT